MMIPVPLYCGTAPLFASCKHQSRPELLASLVLAFLLSLQNNSYRIIIIFISSFKGKAYPTGKKLFTDRQYSFSLFERPVKIKACLLFVPIVPSLRH